MIKESVKAVCGSCGGSGLYSGFCEPEGVYVVCLSCSGSGCQVITYKPFVKRKLLSGVKSVSLSRGRFILSGVGPDLNSVSYQDFLDGKITYNET